MVNDETRCWRSCPAGRVVADANDLETVCALTASGLGIALLTRSVVASRGGRLAVRPLRPRQALPVSLVWRARERPTPAAQAFRKHVLSTIRG
jgi:DNA-binding transcriptional LysR family regulator